MAGGLPELWPAIKQIAVSDAVNYFAGSKYVTTKRVATDGTLYDESVQIPSTKTEAVQAGVKAAVEAGKLWLVSGVASICGEPIPTGVLTDKALLYPPPEPIDVNRLMAVPWARYAAATQEQQLQRSRNRRR